MTHHEPAAARAATMTKIRTYVANVFAARPEFRSILIAVAQYWADEADDAVHAYAVASERETPLWPHRCSRYDDNVIPIAGESCEYCCDEMEYVPFDDNSTAIIGFESYCHEDGSQEESTASNYLPYALARKTDAGITIEIIGNLIRADGELLAPDQRAVAESHARGLDVRATELFALCCAHPRDDGPRRVLADYLLERGDPRGHYMALALADDLDADATAERDALLAKYRFSWIDPLARVIPEPCARYERGLLAHAEVFVNESALVDELASVPAWASVETLHYLPFSLPLIHPVMVALREVGPLRGDALDVIAKAPRPWAIESMAVWINDEDEELPPLRSATTLPKLRELTYHGAMDDLAKLTAAPWWGQLQKLTLLDDFERASNWIARVAELAPLPWLAIARKGDHDRTAGWEIAFHTREHRYEVRLASPNVWSGRDELTRMFEHLPAGPVELVGSNLWKPAADDQVAVAIAGIRDVTLR